MDFKSKGHVYFKNQEEKLLCYEDAHCVALDVEINRKDHIHLLVVPKKVANLSSAGDEHLLGHLLLIAKNLAFKKGLNKTGYSIVVDEDCGTSSLKCLHVYGGPYIGTYRAMKTKSRL